MHDIFPYISSDVSFLSSLLGLRTNNKIIVIKMAKAHNIIPIIF